MTETMKCPKCASSYIHAEKKGFSSKKAVAGSLLFGGIGLAAGGIGKNKIMLTCLSCGYQFKPGEQLAIKTTNIHEDEILYVGPEQTKLYLCSGCGKESSIGSDKKCPKCGKRVNELEVVNLDKKFHLSSFIFWLILLTIIVLLIIFIL